MHVESIFQHRDLLPAQRLEQRSSLEFESDLILRDVYPVRDLVRRTCPGPHYWTYLAEECRMQMVLSWTITRHDAFYSCWPQAEVVKDNNQVI